MYHPKKIVNKKIKVIYKKKKKFRVYYPLISYKRWKTWSKQKKTHYHKFFTKSAGQAVLPTFKGFVIKYTQTRCYKNSRFLTNLYTSNCLYGRALIRPFDTGQITPPSNRLYVPVRSLTKTAVRKIIKVRQFRQYTLTYAKNRLLRKRLRRWTNRYRKIKKHRAYNATVLRLFSTLTGLSLADIKKRWLILRRNNLNYWGMNQLITKFMAQLVLLPHNLLFLLWFISSATAGLFLLKQGAIVLNGAIYTGATPLQPGDVLQLQPAVLPCNALFYSHHRIKSKVAYLQFIHLDMSLLLIFVLRYPFSYELLSTSFLSSRWVRYYVRTFSVKNKHY